MMTSITMVQAEEESTYFATFDVKSDPSGAEVWIDGALRGRTPVEITVIEGLHVVEIKMDGYTTVSKELTFKADSTNHQTFTLSEAKKTTEVKYGNLAVISKPNGAEVYIAGTYKGVTPLTLNDIPVGRYRVTLKKEGYETDSESILVYTGTTETLSMNLSRDGFTPFVLVVPCFFLFLGIVVKRKSLRKKAKAKKQNTEKAPSVKEKQLGTTLSKPVHKIEAIESKQSAIKKQAPKSLTKSISKTTGESNILKKEKTFSPHIEDSGIYVKSAFAYKGAIIHYKVKLENPTSEPIADVKVNLYVPDVFVLSESTKSIPIIKPSESKTVTFDIRPTGECGDCEVSGKVVYYDYKTKGTTETSIPAKNISIVCPMLKSKEITESGWRNTLSGLTKAEETTKEIDIPASTLFEITTDVLQDMNLFMLDPKVNDSGNLYRAVSKFYGEGVKSLEYAAQIEVVGGSSKAKLILKAWAESEDALTGFYHGILDEIEKRVHVKDLIDNNVVNNYHYGDNIGTQITDSVIQRSNIGTSNDKCTGCGKDIVKDEKFCMSCGTAVV
ncbi:PEGA domain-containing protein [Methanolobus profundi]|uniref:PEGA domain-containing protein n=2 Tax=Methanolobus profundi TaxID=487685 RepID=A0A1I4PZK4_9EURY|nr:PEGA domain-containing protein [Methanolobus profundi]